MPTAQLVSPETVGGGIQGIRIRASEKRLQSVKKKKKKKKKTCVTAAALTD